MALRIGRLWTCLGLLLALPVSAAGALSDAQIHARIDTVRSIADAIVVDGDPSDWSGVPSFPDPSGDGTAGSATDITALSIAPRSDGLLVLIETAAAPPTVDLRFWIELDFLGEPARDVQLGVNPTFNDFLNLYPDGAPPIFFGFWEEATLAIGTAVELFVPYDELDAVLPASMQGRLDGPMARSWVRVLAFSSGPGGTEDWGSAVGSFRLIPTPYPLDPPLPAGHALETPVDTPLPLDGLQFVGQGAQTAAPATHAGVWAYDFYRVDSTGSPSDPRESTSNADYPSFGDPFTSPLAGTVQSTGTGHPDLTPFSVVTTPQNFVFLDIGGATGLLFSHARQGSVAVTPSQAVLPGDALGEVGNSGSGSFPHLHYEARHIGGGDPSRPVALTQVEVGLNPTADDPWRRRKLRWDIRSGFFVQNSALTIPALPGLALVGLSVGLALAAWARLHTGGARY